MLEITKDWEKSKETEAEDKIIKMTYTRNITRQKNNKWAYDQDMS